MPTPKEIEEQFLEAYRKASTTSQKFPPDILLRFYAFYKQATEEEGIYKPSGTDELRNGFKANALLQVKGISVLEAKKRYIELADEYLENE